MGIDLNRFRKTRPSEWVEWLSDDPLPPKPQQALPVQPQVHRPATYSPVHRPAVQIPVQQVATASSRPMAPPGLAQPIQPVAAPTPRPVQPTVAAPSAQSVRPAPVMRPVPSPQPMAQSTLAMQRPVSMARPVRPLQSFTPASMVRSIQQNPVVQAMNPGAPASVSIQISMPRLSLPKLPALPYKRISYWAGGAMVFGGLAIGGWTAYKHFGKNSQVAVKGASTVHTSPTFDTLAPQNKPELGQGSDATSTAYDGQRDLYTFKDNLMGFPLVVSQQPLPDNLKKDPNQLQKVAEGMGTNVTSTDTAYGKVYIATSEKGDAQRAVFAYKDVMVLVQSYKTFDADTWKYYVETLRQ